MVFLAPGTKLNGRYVIERVIGQGGFGITYFARHEILDHVYAIKEFYISGYCSRNTAQHTVILQGMSDDMYDKYKKRFLDEAKTVFSLDHPNIVKVVDVFEDNNTAYMVMPFIEGVSLQKMVEDNHGPLPYELTVNYMGQLSDAVAYIHSKHILHRDIKPDNVLITPDNKAMLIDFGSAREFVNDKTQRHTSILTQGYAPLEQYNSVSRKGNYTDIYALGGVYYFCLTGITPVDATARLLEAGTGDDPLKQPKELNPNVTESVNRTIMKAMELRPENRHQTVKEFQDDLLGRNESKEVDDDAKEMPEDDALEMPAETPKIEEKPEVAPKKQKENTKTEQPKDEKKKTFLGYDKKEWKKKLIVWSVFFILIEVLDSCFFIVNHDYFSISRLIKSVLWFIQAAVVLGFFVWIIRLLNKKNNSDIVWPFIISGLGIVSIVVNLLFNIHYSGIEFFILAMLVLATIFVYRPEKFKALPYIVMTAMLTWLCLMTVFMMNFWGVFLHTNLHYYWQLSYSYYYLETIYGYDYNIPIYRFVLGYDYDLPLFVAIPTVTLLVLGIINATKARKTLKDNPNASPVETKPETAIADEKKPESPKKKKSKAWWIILIILILGGAGFAIWRHQENLRIQELDMYYSCYDANTCRQYLKAYPNGRYRYDVQSSLDRYVNDSIEEARARAEEERKVAESEWYKENGLINGIFSISSYRSVCFSKGNLQYQASTDTWRFAENQWDYIGYSNEYISSTYSGWIDLFGWGTGDRPTKHLEYNDYSTFHDWGNNYISYINYGSLMNWRTLSRDELCYLFYYRDTDSGIRYAKAYVNGVNGVILLPDDWSSEYYYLRNVNDSYANNYSDNWISSSEWTNKLEANGAVFFPAAGYRDPASANYPGEINTGGNYWLSTPVNPYGAYYFTFGDTYCSPESYVEYSRRWGCSVRLVSDRED